MFSECSTNPMEVQTFSYPPIPGCQVEVEGPNEPDATAEAEKARSEGILEGESRARSAYERSLTSERRAITTAIQEFAVEKKRYYDQVEREIVELALAIARKILLREAQVDPLLLAGVVRVALDRIGGRTRTRLRVNSSEAKRWQAIVDEMGRSGGILCVEGDASISAGNCRLETELGSTELGIEPQLKEVESGLMDILSKKPQQHE